MSVTQSCQTLWDSMDCSPPGSSVHGMLQARILEWVAISFTRGSSQPKDPTGVFCLLHWQAGSLALAPPGKLQVPWCDQIKKKKRQTVADGWLWFAHKLYKMEEESQTGQIQDRFRGVGIALLGLRTSWVTKTGWCIHQIQEGTRLYTYRVSANTSPCTPRPV